MTALRDAGRDRFAVELDGEHWRILSAEVITRAGLTSGLEVDRPRLRLLRRELRRSEAMARAVASLRHRPLSAKALEERLARAGVAAPERHDVLERLERAGYLGDERLARARAELLVGRSAGNAFIQQDLITQGFASKLVDLVVDDLPPEEGRAARVVARRGENLKCARYLAQRGFDENAIAAALPAFATDS